MSRKKSHDRSHFGHRTMIVQKMVDGSVSNQRQRVTCEVQIDEADLRSLMYKASKNKSLKAKAGPIIVQVTAIDDVV